CVQVLHPPLSMVLESVPWPGVGMWRLAALRPFSGCPEDPKGWLGRFANGSSGELCWSCWAGVGMCPCKTSEARCC
ncbi:MAG: hypothetical protein AVDCRST_MAG15-3100, partial [uncultured Rubellimicrobium sp.]